MHGESGESMIKRRKVIAALEAVALTAAPIRMHALAQSLKKPQRVGVLWHASNAAEEGPYFDSVIEGFKQLGYVDGKTIVLDHRYPNEEPEKFRTMAAELVALKPDLIIAAGGP